MGRFIITVADPRVSESLAAEFSRLGHQIVHHEDAVDGSRPHPSVDLHIVDGALADTAGFGSHSGSPAGATEPAVLVVLASDPAKSVNPQNMSAVDWDLIRLPIDSIELAIRVARLLEARQLRRSAIAWHALHDAAQPSRPLIGASPGIRHLRQQVAEATRSDEPLLIRGEAGIGKETLARAIHAGGDRASKPVAVVSCNVGDEESLELELFGQIAGLPSPSSPAKPRRAGWAELANGGTIVLSEIRDLSSSTIEKLIRLANSGAYQPLNSTIWRHADVRLIATTRSLPRHDIADSQADPVVEGIAPFAPMTIELPPLRDRLQDIPEMARHFLSQIARRTGDPYRHLDAEAVRLLQRYPWPGNVRELQGVIERAAVVEGESGVLRGITLAPWLTERSGSAGPSDASVGVQPLAEVERQVIISTLERFKGHRAKTAGALGIGIRTLGLKLKRWREEGRPAEPDPATQSTRSNRS